MFAGQERFVTTVVFFIFQPRAVYRYTECFANLVHIILLYYLCLNFKFFNYIWWITCRYIVVTHKS